MVKENYMSLYIWVRVNIAQLQLSSANPAPPSWAASGGDVQAMIAFGHPPDASCFMKGSKAVVGNITSWFIKILLYREPLKLQGVVK